MDTVLSKILPYEGIPELVLKFFTPEYRHEYGSSELVEKLEKKYLTYENGIPYFNGKINNWREDDKPVESHPYPFWTVQTWLKYGKTHRDGDKPAKHMIDNEMSNQTMDAWFKNGVCHRDGDMPAYISTQNGEVSMMEWILDGKLVKRFENGSWYFVE